MSAPYPPPPPPPPPPVPTGPAGLTTDWTLFAVIAGAVLAVVGSILPWVKATVPFFGSVEFAGTDGDGKITLALGAAVLLSLVNHAVWRSLGLVAALGLLGISLYDISNISNAIDDVPDEYAGMVSASVGIGLWVVLIASLVAIVGIVVRSGWLDRWGTRRYYALAAVCAVALGLGIVLSDSDSGGSESLADADLDAGFVDDEAGQLGLEDAGDQNGDGTDECLMWATDPAEYEACEEAGSDPADVWAAQNPGESYVSDDLPTQDAGDTNGDGYDDCLEYATTDAEFDMCEAAGSDPADVAEAREAIGATDLQRPGEEP